MPVPQEWEIFDAQRPVLAGLYGANRARMLAFGLADGTLCVVSPGSGLDEARFAALEAHGRPSVLLAPNHFHNAGIAPWKQRYSEAIVVAHPTAIPRLRRQVPGVEVQDLSALQARLAEGTRLLSPPMARQGETWVSVKMQEGTAWFVTDGIINETRLPSGPLGWFLKIVGFRTRLMTNPFFKRLFLKDKSEYKRWVLRELEQDPPAVFIPAHGAVLRGADLVERLAAVTREA